jgi:septal ring factor EnvC (AmiA/AmiB activator)
MAAQARQASFKAISLIHSEMTESSKKIAVLEAVLEKTKKELEKTKHELMEEIKKRKGLEMKVDMMFEWFKSQKK